MEEQDFVAQDTALESMRSSDFDCYSAYGEVIDNSIQALASDIRIYFEESENLVKNKKKISRVFFADNGIGMNADLLHKCLKLGHSSRYNDRSGIGRFGVGMTLGAIHECRKVEVFSKQAGGDWNYTYIDLDDIQNGVLKYIPIPIRKTPESKYTDFINSSGTLVIWSKYDRQVDKYEDILAETKIWLGRTFRKFIWGTAKGFGVVEIKVNNVNVQAIDPLYYTKDKTGFETEEKAFLFEKEILKTPVPEEFNNSLQTSDVIINMSLLPKDYRRERGKGGDKFAEARFIDRNEGVSILRNDREVFYGNIPYSYTVDPRDRFIGIEISFDAILDTEFSVKNIKRGAVPIRELKDKIVSHILPTIRTQREVISNGWNEALRDTIGELDDKNKALGISPLHKATMALLTGSKDTIIQKGKLGETKSNTSIAKKINPKADERQIAEIINGLKENGITIDEREFIGGDFLDIDHGNGLKTLIYNTNSTFYKAYKEILQELNSDLANDYKVLIDLIFVAYMLAEDTIDPNEELMGADFVSSIKSNWALELTKILRKWKK
jgi:Histidine kinase-, DNA gyrase B-, and HSP90-like ATPase